jgi:transcriptional regulator with XRE-family HTH domain
MTDDHFTKIRTLRSQVRLTQRQLADQLGRSEMTVWNWEQGRCKPPATVRPLLARVLGVTIEELEL